MYYVYILYSKTIDRYYIGYTNSPDERLYKHNKRHKGYTAQVDDWVLRYQETYPTKTDAIKRERQIKRWKSRKMIEQLLS